MRIWEWCTGSKENSVYYGQNCERAGIVILSNSIIFFHHATHKHKLKCTFHWPPKTLYKRSFHACIDCNDIELSSKTYLIFATCMALTVKVTKEKGAYICNACHKYHHRCHANTQTHKHINTQRCMSCVYLDGIEYPGKVFSPLLCRKTRKKNNTLYMALTMRRECMS